MHSSWNQMRRDYHFHALATSALPLSGPDTEQTGGIPDMVTKQKVHTGNQTSASLYSLNFHDSNISIEAKKIGHATVN
jgi:hypothetical protein